jgi:heme exporter protein D
MHWNSLSEFLNMGGYALYVWGSFGVTLLAMLTEPILIRMRRIEILRNLRRARAAEGETT